LGYTAARERATDGRHHPGGADRAVGSGAADGADPGEARACRSFNFHVRARRSPRGDRGREGAASHLYPDTRVGAARAAGARHARCGWPRRNPCAAPPAKRGVPAERRANARHISCESLASRAAERQCALTLASCEIVRTSSGTRDPLIGLIRRMGSAARQLCQPPQRRPLGALAAGQGLSHLGIPGTCGFPGPLAGARRSGERSDQRRTARRPAALARALGRDPAVKVTRFRAKVVSSSIRARVNVSRGCRSCTIRRGRYP